MTSKEALEKLYYGIGSEKEYNESYMTIYKDLERLEKLENNSLVKALNKANKKYLKLLDILINKDVDKEELLKSNNVEEYNKHSFKANILTKEEYEILKEGVIECQH